MAFISADSTPTHLVNLFLEGPVTFVLLLDNQGYFIF
jgi:hypothetical protein